MRGTPPGTGLQVNQLNQLNQVNQLNHLLDLVDLPARGRLAGKSTKSSK
jgi:hypothetical protein